MNKSIFIKITLLLLLMIVMSGCTGPEPEPGAEPELESTPTTPQPTAPPEAESRSLEDLSLGMKVIDAEFVNSFAQSGDMFAVWIKEDLTWTEGLLATIPVENRMLMTGSLEGLEEKLDALQVEITYLGYDLERWDRTPLSEQENPVEAVKRAQEIAHAHGLTLVLGPSKYFNDKYGPELARYTDIYVPQMKGYQADLSAEAYHETVRSLLIHLKEANPELILFLDVSPTSKGIEKSPEEMLESVQAVQDLIDGIWMSATRKEVDQLKTFIEIVREGDAQAAPSASPTADAADAPDAPDAADSDQLALGMRVFNENVTRLEGVAQPGDIYGLSYRRGIERMEELLSQLPVENRMLMTATIEGLEEVLDSLSIEISYIGYDLERWDATSEAEQLEPVEAAKKMQEIAHARGLKVALGPSRYFNEKYGVQLAPYTDVYIPQAKGYQAQLSPEKYKQVVRQLILNLKQANPEMRVFLDLSPTPKDVEKTPAEMLATVDAVRDLVDGVWVTANQNEVDTVGAFVELLR